MKNTNSTAGTSNVILGVEDFRRDHCNGENGLYRLAASVPYEESTFDDKYIDDLVSKLNKLPIRPTRIFVHTECIEIDWAPQGYLVVCSELQYALLILEFSMFIQQVPIEGLELQLGFLHDDPGLPIEQMKSKSINYTPHFNSECFDSDESIEVFVWR